MLIGFRSLVIFLSLLFATPSNLFGSTGGRGDPAKELLKAYSSGDLMAELANNARDGKTDLPPSLTSWNMVVEPMIASINDIKKPISLMEALARNIKQEIGDDLQRVHDKSLFMILASHLMTLKEDSKSDDDTSRMTNQVSKWVTLAANGEMTSDFDKLTQEFEKCTRDEISPQTLDTIESSLLQIFRLQAALLWLERKAPSQNRRQLLADIDELIEELGRDLRLEPQQGTREPHVKPTKRSGKRSRRGSKGSGQQPQETDNAETASKPSTSQTTKRSRHHHFES